MCHFVFEKQSKRYRKSKAYSFILSYFSLGETVICLHPNEDFISTINYIWIIYIYTHT